ncbi:MAG: GTP-binding protein, partial [Verrucomicrobiota bacterium]
LAEQLAFASIIILTKIDTIEQSAIDAQVKNLQKLQPKAAIGLSAQAGLLLPQLEGTPAPKISFLKKQAEKFGLTQQDSTAENVEALVLRDPRPFHPERLHQACQNHLGTGLYRTKGFLWMASRPGDVLLWQQSGSQIALELTGFWRAEVVHNKGGKLLPEEIEMLQEMLKSQHPIFGDRANELTLIGLEKDREAFYAALQDALCTDAEIEAWQAGATFADPWPQSLRRIE